MLRNERLQRVAVETSQRQSSRRGFLSGSAKLAGGGALALALAGSPLSVFAQDRGGVPGEANEFPGDLDVLNYALTLEHLEKNFYIQAVEKFSEAEIEDYLKARRFGPAVYSGAYQRIVNVRNHEITHVKTLQQVIMDLGGDPVPPCEYDFSAALTDVQTFLGTSAVLENTGVRAYDGAIALIESRVIQTASATIATVEARHAGYFNLLNKKNPFPQTFDRAILPEQIIEAVLATGLIVSCPVAPPIPDEPNGCTP